MECEMSNQTFNC